MDAQDRWQSVHDSCVAHGWLCDHVEVRACADFDPRRQSMQEETPPSLPPDPGMCQG